MGSKSRLTFCTHSSPPTVVLGLTGLFSTSVEMALVISFPLWGPVAAVVCLGYGIWWVLKHVVRPLIELTFTVLAYPLRPIRYMLKRTGKWRQYQAEHGTNGPFLDKAVENHHPGRCGCEIDSDHHSNGRPISSCWACGSQVCNRCSIQILPETPRTIVHLELCEPRCSTCYLNFLCRTTWETDEMKSCTHCNPKKASRPDPTHEDACTGCAGETLETVRVYREQREVEELRHLAKSSLRCGLCKRGLGKNGPRWWACCKCGQECKSAYHPAWMLS